MPKRKLSTSDDLLRIARAAVERAGGQSRAAAALDPPVSRQALHAALSGDPGRYGLLERICHELGGVEYRRITLWEIVE